MLHKFLCLIFVLVALQLKAQVQYSGIVYDKATHEVLVFVNIISADGKYGTSSDIEGKFKINVDAGTDALMFSYVGYQKQRVELDKKGGRLIVYLEHNSVELNAFEVYPGVNPADVLMEKVIAKKNENNPEKNVDFSYNSYNKLFVTMALDSSLILHPEKLNDLDSNDQEALDFFSKQHLFMAESVTERKFKQPASNSEIVLASKVSGFQNPIFNLLATELQSFTFYKDFITLAGIKYEGPLTKNATSRYFFLLEDTLYDGQDSIFVLSFRPKKGKDFKGLKGTLGIHTANFALKTVKAEPAKSDTVSLGIKIQQQYERIDGQWFPVQLNTVLLFQMIKINNFNAIGIANGYLKSIQINPDLKRKEFSAVDLKMDKTAAHQSDEFWNQYRNDTLTEIEKNTYISIDSISKKYKLEKKINTLTYLIDMQIPVGPISIQIDRLFSYNDYEGFRGGLGLQTNDRVSKYMNIGGYVAYGFKDKAIKYGGDLNFLLPKKDAGLTFSMSHDLSESGHVDYKQKPNLFNSSDLSALFVNRYDWSDKMEATIYFHALQHFKVYAFINHKFQKSFGDYSFQQSISEFVTVNISEYKISEAGSILRFQFREKFIEGPKRLLSKGSDYPVLWVKYTRGLSTDFSSDFSYNKLDIRLEKKHPIRGFGYISYQLDAGKVMDPVPYSIGYNHRGTYRDIKNFAVVSGRAFETMRTNEFYSDNYFSYQLKYDFKSFIKKGKWRPELSLLTKGLFGSVKQVGAHQHVTFSTAEKGFFESGLLINQLLKMNTSGFGIGVFYRHGPYQLPNTIDNWSFKLSMSYSLF